MSWRSRFTFAKKEKNSGDWGEDIACLHLKSLKYKILTRNFRCPLGEIDIIAKKDKKIIFVEVKYRKSATYGGPKAAITLHKQKKIIKTAHWYLKSIQKGIKNPQIPDCRFDIVTILGSKANFELELITNAFLAPR